MKIVAENIDPFIVIGGDFNQLSDFKIQSLGLMAEFYGPTHKGNSLDRIYVSEPAYIKSFAVDSSIVTKHKGVFATAATMDIDGFVKKVNFHFL